MEQSRSWRLASMPGVLRHSSLLNEKRLQSPQGHHELALHMAVFEELVGGAHGRDGLSSEIVELRGLKLPIRKPLRQHRQLLSVDPQLAGEPYTARADTSRKWKIADLSKSRSSSFSGSPWVASRGPEKIATTWPSTSTTSAHRLVIAPPTKSIATRKNCP